jgi:diguanylate cyclase (GGDEF)-like protein
VEFKEIGNIILTRVQLGKGFIGRAALTAKPVVLSPISQDPRFGSEVLEVYGLRSISAVPVMARDQVKGVICMGSREQQQSIEKDTRMLELIANQIGIALENSLLYAKTVGMAFTDRLTGLYNRRYLVEELKHEIARSKRNQKHIAIISMDMDGLKLINDKFGYDQGDRLLKQFSVILKHNIRKSDIAARMGGDEFVLIAPETTLSQASIIANRILAETNSHFIEIEGEKHFISVSIGIYSFPKHGETTEDLLDQADKAMFEAKRNDKNRIVLAV